MMRCPALLRHPAFFFHALLKGWDPDALIWLPSARPNVTGACVLLQVNWEQVNSNYQAAKAGKVPEVL